VAGLGLGSGAALHGRADSARVRTRGRVRVPHTSVHDSRKLPGSNTTTLILHYQYTPTGAYYY
jgi:hypothetical protein